MQVPHEGGRRFSVDSQEYLILREWIADGMPADPDTAPRLVRLDVAPTAITLLEPQRDTKLKATATFSDGSERDVTTLAVLESSDPAVRIADDGTVAFGESRSSRQTSVTVRYLNQQATARIEFVPARPGFEFSAPAPANVIDTLVFAQLQRLQINPSPVCDDTTFLRRVYLDVTGRLPTCSKRTSFLTRRTQTNAATLIDRIARVAGLRRLSGATLGRSAASRRQDAGHERRRSVLSLDSRKHRHRQTAEPVRRGNHSPLEAARTPSRPATSTGLCGRRKNEPNPRRRFFWVFVCNVQSATIIRSITGHRTTITAGPTSLRESTTRSSKTNAVTKTTSMNLTVNKLSFMKDEGNVKNPTTGKTAGLRYLGDARAIQRPGDKSTRSTAAAIHMAGIPDNHRFAATQANRVWFQLMGQGIVDPIDDFRSTNPASNPELLNAVTQEFVSQRLPRSRTDAIDSELADVPVVVRAQ